MDSWKAYRMDEAFFATGSSNGLTRQGNAQMLRLLTLVVLLLLLSAVFNYVNLSLALTGKRAKEMATRRLLGADKSGILWKYIRLPVELLDRGLSPAAMVLYGVLLGRLSLSGKNGWRDKEGEVFVCCTNREICRLLHCGHDKATKVLRELEGAKLLRCARQQGGRACRLYPLPFGDMRKSRPERAEEPLCSVRENPGAECGKTAPSHIEKNYYKKSYTYAGYGQRKKEYEKQREKEERIRAVEEFLRW